MRGVPDVAGVCLSKYDLEKSQHIRSTNLRMGAELGKHGLPERGSVYIVGDESGIYGLSYEPVSDIEAGFERERDAPANAGPGRLSDRADPSGVTSLLDPAYLAGCALGLPELDETDRGRFIDSADDYDDELHD